MCERRKPAADEGTRVPRAGRFPARLRVRFGPCSALLGPARGRLGRGFRRPVRGRRGGRPGPLLLPAQRVAPRGLRPALGCRCLHPAWREPRGPVLGAPHAPGRSPPAAGNHTAQLPPSVSGGRTAQWPSGHRCCPRQPHGPGVEGPPAPQRVPGEASPRASHREELGRGECKAWSSLCFKALKPAPRSCKARDRGAGGGRSRVAGDALDLEWKWGSPQLRGPHVWPSAPESRWSDFGVRRRRPCGRPSAH